ncbi:FKBP-type peptidyl-prolyl cis-trans isomerase [uncultured Algibacter sp.]|uniref:FKBP-type peptidyl-prolyl cis-trans isomerase n=1 Tax=uncultured Algibacter sp. TaxID=298659 RepID=UPI002613BB42|nr:FKBP-type peptidyl-prolyl cis-trans isomerase [uncultured Algibacter sp.]
MNLIRISLLTFCFVIGLASCKKDDNDGFVPEPIRDRTEQQAADKDSIIQYLENHYYNASIFDDYEPNVSSKDLIITELVAGEDIPDGQRLLIDDVVTKDVTFADTEYEIWYIDLNDKKSDPEPSPTFADNVIVTYEGFTLDGDVFDSAVTPTNFDLTTLIPGWRKVLPDFKVAENFMENEDGTVSYVNHGVGIMFVPSGLAYFSTGTTAGIGPYEPINFKFDLLQKYENDHDNDNVPSYKEDLNGDGEFTLNTSADERDGDDTDNNGTPDYFDADDDGDGVPTINEDIDKDGDPTNDIGKNGIPKYLDPDETESNGL